MPLDPVSLTAVVRSALLGVGMIGTGSNQLTVGLANALSNYSKTAMIVNTIDVGTLGVGKGVGVGVLLAQPALFAALSSFFPSSAISGVSALQLATGISIGYSSAFATAIINTVHPSVGVGSGKLQISPNTAAAIGIFTTAFLSAGMTGNAVPQLASAVARALDSVLPTAIGIVAIAGSPSVVGSSGSGTGKLI